MLNKQWHVSPPALKAAEPVGPHTYTLFVFPVIFLTAVTRVLMSVLLPLPATPHKVILKGLKFSFNLEESPISNHFLKYCKMYDSTCFWSSLQASMEYSSSLCCWFNLFGSNNVSLVVSSISYSTMVFSNHTEASKAVQGS